MNSKTYLKLIADRYGGNMKSELEVKLKRLVDLTIWEQSRKQNTTPQVINIPVQKTVQTPVYTTTQASKSPNRGTYERAMALIRQFNNTGWKHILEVPDDLFKDFWAIAEMHPEIVFDDIRDYQYFRVINFGYRQTDWHKEKLEKGSSMIVR